MTNASSCTIKYECALISMSHDINSMADENREESNRIVWEEIIENAENSGDALDYDGPLSWGIAQN